MTLTDQSHQIVGNSAIVRHIWTGETESEGKTNAIKIGVLMVWHKQDGRWKLLARQLYKL
jgi:ketosteroid isomerase-like protein